MLQIYNTLTRQKEFFTPILPGKVRMYVCGMTVYDYCHLGHARVMVAFDVVARYFRYRGYGLTYVRNITDVDDKIIQRAQENGESIAVLTERFIAAMHEDERALGVLPPDLEPRATQSIEDIIEMIKALISRGFAYVGANGDVFYAVARFPGYGRLSGKHLDDLRAGERVDIDEAKRDPMDFVLWKRAKPGEPFWESPWGEGRPGWHIECSAMSTRCLGQHFDIHGGGMDLQFPHHENEIAQSEGASGTKFVNIWMHNGFVRVNEEKMSKSLGNFFSVREILSRYQPEVVRFFILNSHYRSPLNYCDENLDEAQSALTRLYTALRGLKTDVTVPLTPAPSGNGLAHPPSGAAAFEQRFRAAMDDDFNTAEAIAVLFDLAREINRQKAEQPALALQLAGQFRAIAGVLGLLQADPDDFLKGGVGNQAEALDETAIESLIQQRLDARSNRDWAEADRIRDSLKAQGVVLEDTAGSTTWRRV
ncbi:MAG: cysteine--tRNA ligase [Methylococcaceae bacterium]|nr:cysteine--tRNA ligase [Methylococcaceae bacterium]